MASASRTATAAGSSAPSSGTGRAAQAAIDASARGPVLLFLVSAIAWLLIASGLSLISSIQLHRPSFLADCAWLTYGRSQAAGLNAAIYGWGFNASFVLVFWLMARLSQATLRVPSVLIVAGLFWNVGVTLGVGGILAGDSTSVPWLEIPTYAAPLLFVAYALIGAWAFVTFRTGRSGRIFASQWYLLAALFWFPWLYSVAQVVLFVEPSRGTSQSVIAAWYAHGVSSLWFTAVALAAIYYFLPKITGKTLRHYDLASLGFWTFLAFSAFAGTASLVGAPVPAWTTAVGVGASLFLIVPVLIIGLNHFPTLAAGATALKTSTSLRFILIGIIAFTVSTLAWVVTSLQSVAVTTQFTLVGSAQTQAVLYGVFSMVAFGGIYFLAPRLAQREWPSLALIGAHFWSSTVGLVLCILGLTLGGLAQGAALNDSAVSFSAIASTLSPYLFMNSLGVILLAIGHLAFAVNVVRLVLQSVLCGAPATDLFREAPSLEAAR
ncbi:cbb3-type cytochrome c oxidase subunit I [Opitutaceae bacterium]